MEAVYEAKGFRLFKGDALDIMRDMPAESFDMIFADPPYFLSNGGFTVHAGKRASVHKGDWDKSRGVADDMIFHQAWIEEARRLLKPDGTIWISGTYHSIYQCGYALQATGFHILNDIAWFKPNASPNLSCRMFTASHETLIWARKDKKAQHYFDYRAMKNGDWPGDMMKKPGLQMRSVWSVNTPKQSEKTPRQAPDAKAASNSCDASFSPRPRPALRSSTPSPAAARPASPRRSIGDRAVHRHRARRRNTSTFRSSAIATYSAPVQRPGALPLPLLHENWRHRRRQYAHGVEFRKRARSSRARFRTRRATASPARSSSMRPRSRPQLSQARALQDARRARSRLPRPPVEKTASRRRDLRDRQQHDVHHRA